jgi:hypothetical protein
MARQMHTPEVTAQGAAHRKGRYEMRPTYLIPILLAGVLLASGCVIAVEDDVLVEPIVADLEVSWTIDRSSSAALCAAYDIQRWEVTVSGPEHRSLTLDCRHHWWSSESDLYELPTGYYDVTITAVDSLDYARSALSSSIDLRSSLYVEQLALDFTSYDF